MHRLTSDEKIFADETGKLLSEIPSETLVVAGVIALMMLLHAGLGIAALVFMMFAGQARW